MMPIENIITLLYTYVNKQLRDEMNIKNEEWLPLDVAAKHFGYAHKESLSRRLRQLRKRGLIRDIGRPPDVYDVEQKVDAAITIMWPNPKTALLYSEVSPSLLVAKRGRPVNRRK